MLRKIPWTTEQHRYTQQWRIDPGTGWWWSSICEAARYSAQEFFTGSWSRYLQFWKQHLPVKEVTAKTWRDSSFLYYPWNCHWFKEKLKAFCNVFFSMVLAALHCCWSSPSVKCLEDHVVLHITRAVTSLCVWSSNPVWFVQSRIARINMTHLRKRETSFTANETEDSWSNKNIYKFYFSCLWLSMT